MKTLDRRNLDVVNKTRSNVFGWRGPFTAELVESGAAVYSAV